uniref:helix-turn-helix domain-containing protein n=1 Tax=Caldicellulosiruptor sp. F32 TaxID=1214564 RepID=UPI0012EA72A7
YEGQYFRGVFWISTEKSIDIYQFLRQKEVLFFVKLTPQKYFFIICCEEIPIDYLHYLHDGIIGISNLHTEDSLISNVFSQANEAAYNTFIYQYNGVFEYSNPCYSIVNQLINDISSAIEKKDSENLKNIFFNLSGFFKSNKLTIGDVTYFWNQLSLYLNKLNPSEYSDMNIMEYDEIVDIFCNIENMSEYLLERIEGVITKNKQFEYCSNENFLKLIEYIDNHYSEPLSLKELSAKFFISLNYCCELFRKVIGCSFTEYLTNLRMKKAEELLKTTNYSIAEIARLVGYNDYYHFNKAFKKFYGTPPATFRRSIQKQIGSDKR